MDKKVTLSVFIATYNIKDIVVNKVKELLKKQSIGFNIYMFLMMHPMVAQLKL